MKKIVIIAIMLFSGSSIFSQEVSSKSSEEISNKSSVELLQSSFNILMKIAESDIDVSNLDLDDEIFIKKGIVTEEEISKFLKNTQDYTKAAKEEFKVGAEDVANCKTCAISNENRRLRFISLINLIRKDKTSFL